MRMSGFSTDLAQAVSRVNIQELPERFHEEALRGRRPRWPKFQFPNFNRVSSEII